MITLPNSLKIGVLRGGPSPEYEVSLKSGANVLKHLSGTHSPVDIFITRDGLWHMNGLERSPERILKNVDVVWNSLHGVYGEDGGVQELLNHHGVPHTSSGRYESALSMNKWMTKDWAIASGLKTPYSMIVRDEDSISEKAKEIFESIPHPLIVKAGRGGGGISAYIVESYSELLSALKHVLATNGVAVVEEYIKGKHVSCLVADNFRGEKKYAFPILEKLHKEHKKEVEESAKKIHEKMGIKHFSKSDFVVSPKRGIYFLEINTVPKFTDSGFVAKSLESVGVSQKDFIHHIISLAINK